MKDFNVAVWGVGPHAIRNILPAIRHSRGLRLYGICSRNADVVAQQSAEQGCLGWNDPGKMLGDPKVEVVYLSTPTGLHAVQGELVLQAGKHLWCEKPLGCNLGEVSRLHDLSEARRVSLAEGYMYLYHPHFAAIKELFDSGFLGHVQRVTCRFGIPPLARPSFRSSPELGGSAFLDLGAYSVSAVNALFPDATPTVLYSKIDTASGSAVDTSGLAILRYSNASHATLEWGVDCAYRNEIDVWGSLGSVSSERFFSKPAEYGPRLRFLDQHGLESFRAIGPGNHFVSMFGKFRSLIDNPAAAAAERAAILRRAGLMNEIVQAQL